MDLRNKVTTKYKEHDSIEMKVSRRIIRFCKKQMKEESLHFHSVLFPTSLSMRDSPYQDVINFIEKRILKENK